jgi:hypothetical protein
MTEEETPSFKCILRETLFRGMIKPRFKRQGHAGYDDMPLGRSRHKWQESTKFDLKESDMGWTDVARDTDQWRSLMS